MPNHRKDELSAVRRENELQQDSTISAGQQGFFFFKARLADWLLCFRLQDLQIYLSDVFELGIEELNEAIRF